MPALRLPVPSGTSSVPRPMRGIHCRFGAYIQCALTGGTEKNRTISDFDEGADTKGKQRRQTWIHIYKREVPIVEVVIRERDRRNTCTPNSQCVFKTIKAT